MSWKDEVAFAHVVCEAPRAYGERDVRRLCRAVIGLYDALKADKAAPQADNAGKRLLAECASEPAGAAPSKFTTFHGADRDTGAPCVFEEINPAYVEYLEKQLAAKQAEIDRLMIEHCPSEMSAEQIVEWAKHQRPIVGYGDEDAAR